MKTHEVHHLDSDFAHKFLPRHLRQAGVEQRRVVGAGSVSDHQGADDEAQGVTALQTEPGQPSGHSALVGGEPEGAHHRGQRHHERAHTAVENSSL